MIRGIEPHFSLELRILESVRLEKILFDHTKLQGDWVVDGDLFIEIVCLNGCSNGIRCLCGKTFVVFSI